MPYPHGNDCQCPNPGPDGGLLHYTLTCDHYRELRGALREVAVLRVTTMPADPPANLVALPDMPRVCDGSMLCDCEACAADRARRVRAGVREIRQPWQPVRRAA